MMVYVWDLTLESSAGNVYVGGPKFNGTLTYLRLGIDGNIRLHTYYGQDRDSAGFETECQLPERCGSFGLCKDNQCVACPSSNGLLGWSETCAPEKLTSCKANSFHYYKVEGVDHFLSKYTRGSAAKEVDCGKKCSSDCKCLGYFYNQETSRCWIAYELPILLMWVTSRHLITSISMALDC